jgi:hypothetical protein
MDQYTTMNWKNLKEGTMKIYDNYTISQVNDSGEGRVFKIGRH